MTTLATGAPGASDAELITAVRAGDHEAFGQLWQRHVDAARRLARQLASSPAEADDLVSEAFAKLLATLRGGGGPDAAFRAYLLTALRNTFYDKIKKDQRVRLSDDLSTVDPGVPFRDTAVEGLEASLAARAFASLPERWQTVLWHTEIEGDPPATIAPILGLSANGVSALAYRAREGLRQAYLQLHLADTVADPCRAIVDRLGAWARGGLSRREAASVDAHLKTCDRCPALAAELLDVNHGLRGVIAPLVIGAPFVAGYLGSGTAATGAAAAGGAGATVHGAGVGSASAAAGAHAPTAAPAAGGAAGHAGPLAFVRAVPRPGQAVVAAAAAVAVVAAAAFAFALTGHHSPTRRSADPEPRLTSAAPAPPSPAPSRPPAPPASEPHRSSASAQPSRPAATVRPSAPPPATRAQPTTAVPTTAVPTGPTPTPTPTPVPTPTVPPTRPPPSPTTTPTTTPTSPPTTPPPTTPPPPPPSAHLTPTLAAIGSLVVGRNGVLDIGAANTGTAATGPLTGTVTLPAGVGAVSVSGAGWSLRSSGAAAGPDAGRPSTGGTTVTLTGPSVSTAGSASGYLAVRVAADAPVGGLAEIRLRGTAPGSTAGSTTRTALGVQDTGLGADVSGVGRAAVLAVGNTFVSCPELGSPGRGWFGCSRARHRGGPDPVNDFWTMVRWDADDDPATPASSSADLVLPAGARITWAGLYWSGRMPATGSAPSISLRGPAAVGYRALAAERVEQAALNGRPVFQSFADVTALVRTGGRWWAALSGDPVTGSGAYGGWSLVVVVERPDLPLRRVSVFDSFAAVTDAGAVTDPTYTGGRGPGVVTTVAWEGDEGRTGDQVGLDATPLAPCPATCDMENSTADGAVPDVPLQPWNTFGTDVHHYAVDLAPTANHVIDARSTSDWFLLGVVGLETAAPTAR